MSETTKVAKVASSRKTNLLIVVFFILVSERTHTLGLGFLFDQLIFSEGTSGYRPVPKLNLWEFMCL